MVLWSMVTFRPEAHAAVDVGDLILAVRPEAIRAGLPYAADCFVVFMIAGVRQPEERTVLGPLLPDRSFPM